MYADQNHPIILWRILNLSTNVRLRNATTPENWPKWFAKTNFATKTYSDLTGLIFQEDYFSRKIFFANVCPRQNHIFYLDPARDGSWDGTKRDGTRPQNYHRKISHSSLSVLNRGHSLGHPRWDQNLESVRDGTASRSVPPQIPFSQFSVFDIH